MKPFTILKHYFTQPSITQRSLSPLLLTHLAALIAFSLLRSPMHPMMVGGRLFSILSHTDIPKRWLARHLAAIHGDRKAAGVNNDFTSRTFHPGSMFLVHIWRRSQYIFLDTNQKLKMEYFWIYFCGNSPNIQHRRPHSKSHRKSMWVTKDDRRRSHLRSNRAFVLVVAVELSCLLCSWNQKSNIFWNLEYFGLFVQGGVF